MHNISIVRITKNKVQLSLSVASVCYQTMWTLSADVRLGWSCWPSVSHRTQALWASCPTCARSRIEWSDTRNHRCDISWALIYYAQMSSPWVWTKREMDQAYQLTTESIHPMIFCCIFYWQKHVGCNCYFYIYQIVDFLISYQQIQISHGHRISLFFL